MKILVVDDNNEKVIDVVNVAKEAGVEEAAIEVATTAATAMKALKSSYFDLLIVDLVLPLRLGEGPDSGGGAALLKNIHRSKDMQAPEVILGLTVDPEALQNSQTDFSDHLWSIELAGPNNGEWKLKLQQKIQYLTARENQREGIPLENRVECDVLFVCALASPELEQLHIASGASWEQVTFPSDPILYWKATLEIEGHNVEAFSICLPQMGLVAAATGVSQATRTLSPKIVIMTGICGGRRGDCNLGDVIAANVTWDYGSGKFVQGEEGQVEFQPAPVQLISDATIQRCVTSIITDGQRLNKFYQDCPGYRTSEIPTLHIGPMASGAAVQNHKEFFNGVADQNRKILGVDMEAFGVAWACHQSFEPHPRWLIVKGVSDFADGTKADNVQRFASFMSAKVGLEVMRNLL
ncbi:5'-methylthioadenosine/S-adenosylhomocysteine nucleosidase [Phaeobacter piscinae]|uniref:5'-methylthioadenosine/S-adenosylhomocysteine nucleosidase n=1 Tax=Phaeobacter piscinae TaxID=1580596 RepID=A0ABN5DHE4_9RHOB|nr:response regulator [Phaeobacter piscinae]ATG36760.1 5'-methylthioadenosine/S-adenosylhomocysteine nucleosidase [Phaeobacter piscinae]AUQ87281.1 5'-methylthioadenosine/S-adenosylhomocysteine nucleosidase [Phaeobacter piscinae]AUR25164.1 5'-methylthioadenosine/S-adenosylhomocysteine nucleosidase [Phaeobacter piscinae]